jgi:tungstate transport system permease protein
MLDLSEAFHAALRQISVLDPQLIEIVGLSLKVTLTAVAIATTIGLALGGALAVYRFPGRGALAAILNALMGLPPVVAGLFVYLLLSNAGPLGVLQLLYTPQAMIIAQVILITPIIAALTRQTCEDLLEEYREQLRSLGASSAAIVTTLLWDGRYRLVTAVLASHRGGRRRDDRRRQYRPRDADYDDCDCTRDLQGQYCSRTSLGHDPSCHCPCH